MGLFDKWFGKEQPENLALTDLSLPGDSHVHEFLQKEWQWLIGEDKEPIKYSACGDVFLKNPKGSVYWLRTTEGKLTQVVDSVVQFEAMLKQSDVRLKFFQAQRFLDLRTHLGALPPGKCYGFKLLPVLGGSDGLDNRVILPLVEHVGFTGSVHRQVHDLPPGSTIQIKIVD